MFTRGQTQVLTVATLGSIRDNQLLDGIDEEESKRYIPVSYTHLDVYKRQDCIYTGLTTDTGCFRYRSVTPCTHRIAAEVIEWGADAGEINRVMFESKSKAQVEAERIVLDGMESVSYTHLLRKSRKLPRRKVQRIRNNLIIYGIPSAWQGGFFSSK